MMKSPFFSSDWVAVIVVGFGIAVGPGLAMARPLGIDVSSYQGSINWSSVQNSGRSFAWAKATEGTFYVDPYFTGNESGAKAAGVLIGAYHFAHPDDDPGTSGADAEAAFFWNEAKNYLKDGGVYLVPLLDFEVSSGSGASMSAWINQWCQDIKNYGAANGVVINPVVYTDGSIASSLSGSVTQWPLVIADPNGESSQTGGPTVSIGPWGTWTFWQYSFTGSVPGVSGSCDEDVIDGSSSTLQAFAIGTGTVSAGPGVTIHWDPGSLDASPGSGGNGNWDNNTADWWLTTQGDIAWSTGGDYAVFDGTAGTVTLQADVNADELKFNTDGYTISGASHTLTLNSPGDIIVPPGNNTHINCVLAGVGFKLSGGGALTLNNAANTSGSSSSAQYVTGPNTTLTVATDHDAGSADVTLNLVNGGVYQNNDSTASDQFLLPGSAIALKEGGGILYNPNASLTMSDYITGPGSLTAHVGPSVTLTLNDAGNDYTGGTIVNGPGTLKASSAGCLGSTSGSVTVNGGILALGTASHNVGVVTISGGTIQNGTLTGSSYAGQSGTVFAVLAGSGAMTKTTSGTLTLSGAETYSGNTTISAGTLALGGAGSINNTPMISIAGGATFDVSAFGTYTLSGNTTLKATGSAMPATINGGTTVNLGSQPVILNTDGVNPSLTIAQGTLSLHGNAFTVNKTIELAGGVYTIIQQASGNITSSGSYSVTGTAIPAFSTAVISVSLGSVLLTITGTTTTTLNSLTPSTYGQSVTFTATVAPTPAGGTVQFYDNGVALGNPVTVSGGTASYSIGTLVVGSHPITASYNGTTGYGASTTTSASTQVVMLPANTIPVHIVGVALLGDGTAQMNFTGTPGYIYLVQGATNLNPPITWTNLSTNAADSNGVFGFTDLCATNYTDRFYRTATQ